MKAFKGDFYVTKNINTTYQEENCKFCSVKIKISDNIFLLKSGHLVYGFEQIYFLYFTLRLSHI